MNRCTGATLPLFIRSDYAVTVCAANKKCKRCHVQSLPSRSLSLPAPTTTLLKSQAMERFGRSLYGIRL